jgi:hypothetical protein
MTSLFVASRGGGETNGQWAPVGRLDRIDGRFRFRYTRGAETLENFRPFVGMPDLHKAYESDDLLPLFANRLLSRSRPEYDAHLRWGGFDPKTPPDAITLLSVTEGRRATDVVEVFACPEADANGCYISTFYVHGLRWLPQSAKDRVDRLHAGDVLHLMHDASNAHDTDAMMLLTAAADPNTKIGFVPRYLAPDIRWLASRQDNSPEVTVVRVNTDAPVQHRLLCRARMSWPANFRPCAGEAFEPVNGGGDTNAPVFDVPNLGRATVHPTG